MAFVEVQFPVDISYGSSGGPEFSTEVVILGSGHEQRNANWSESRARYNVAWGVKNATQLAALIAFFRARKGRAIGFRFKDWSDFSGTDEYIGTGDDSEVDFQLIKTYSSGGEDQVRDIKKPVSGSVTIYIDDVEEVSGWTVDTETGIVTFSAAPLAGEVITADYDFDVPVRFDVDHLPLSIDDYGINSALDIRLIEVRVEG